NLKLTSKVGNRHAVMKNLATSIILYEKVKTTAKMAKMVAPMIDKLILTAKKENKMNVIRTLSTMVFNEKASKKLLELLRERYKDRKSGFTRITAIEWREGDNAPLVQIELV
ncbi:50S ribosomal protein L17, partial [Candidatus Peregrinibacteria bacterium]|nr:50S ribosomal protein L17 [Candidatus Peregrinibacteria bacterium]